MLKNIEKCKSILVLLAFMLVSLTSNIGVANAAQEDEEKVRIVNVDCNKDDDLQDALDTNANDKRPLIINVKGICENEEGIFITRNKVSFNGDAQEGGYITGVIEIQGGRGISFNDNMTLDFLVIEYSQVFLVAKEGKVEVNGGVGVNFQSVLDIDTEGSNGEVMINTDISLINHSLLLIQQEESKGSVTTRNIFATLQSSANIKEASIGDMNVGSDSHAVFDLTVKRNGDVPGSLGCDSESRYWGIVDIDEFPFFGNCIGI